VSARISFSSNWTEQYDQAGLLFSLRKNTAPPSAEKSPPKWIKTGVEFYNGKPMLSTVACDTWADWSVSAPNSGTGSPGTKTWTTILVQKEGDEHGMSLWVYEVLETGEKIPLREICWVLGHAPEEWDLEVLALAARPAKDAKGSLEVEIKDMVVEWAA
jgi:regulation of enolase protein 1 (concanavalin A-like superfamily)